ncbi:MAG: hypothetical protein AAF490_06040 [Chloroflexota bacterium]
MHLFNLKSFRLLVGTAIVGVLGIVFGITAVQNAGATDGNTFTHKRANARLTVQGHVCHGANVYNNLPLSDYANAESFLEPEIFEFWTEFSPPEVGVLGPDGALDVTADTPLDSIMATHLSDGMAELLGQDLANLVPEEQLNVPIHDSYTPVLFDFDGSVQSRQQLPWQVPAPFPNVDKFTVDWNHREPITLAQWNLADGTVHLVRYADGTGSVHIKAQGLVPNAIYTVWEVFAITDELPEGIAPIMGLPMGGLPNVVTADKFGNATFDRHLDYDPFDLENPLMYIALFQHWDNVLYGVGAVGELRGLAPGLVGGDQLCFPTGNHLLDIQSRN